MSATCTECKQPLIMVDNRGQWLRGCGTCNIWDTPEGARVKLSVEDLHALGNRRSPGEGAFTGALRDRINKWDRSELCSRSSWGARGPVRKQTRSLRVVPETPRPPATAGPIAVRL